MRPIIASTHLTGALQRGAGHLRCPFGQFVANHRDYPVATHQHRRHGEDVVACGDRKAWRTAAQDLQRLRDVAARFLDAHKVGHFMRDAQDYSGVSRRMMPATVCLRAVAIRSMACPIRP
jgi:hypothetical protein